jgi:hypothetical protein
MLNAHPIQATCPNFGPAPFAAYFISNRLISTIKFLVVVFEAALDHRDWNVGFRSRAH